MPNNPPGRHFKMFLKDAERHTDYYLFTGKLDNTEFSVAVDEDVIEYLYEDFKLRDTPAPLLTQAQYKERLASEGILPEDY